MQYFQGNQCDIFWTIVIQLNDAGNLRPSRQACSAIVESLGCCGATNELNWNFHCECGYSKVAADIRCRLVLQERVNLPNKLTWSVTEPSLQLISCRMGCLAHEDSSVSGQLSLHWPFSVDSVMRRRCTELRQITYQYVSATDDTIQQSLQLVASFLSSYICYDFVKGMFEISLPVNKHETFIHAICSYCLELKKRCCLLILWWKEVDNCATAVPILWPAGWWYFYQW